MKLTKLRSLAILGLIASSSLIAPFTYLQLKSTDEISETNLQSSSSEQTTYSNVEDYDYNVIINTPDTDGDGTTAGDEPYWTHDNTDFILLEDSWCSQQNTQSGCGDTDLILMEKYTHHGGFSGTNEGHDMEFGIYFYQLPESSQYYGYYGVSLYVYSDSHNYGFGGTNAYLDEVEFSITSDITNREYFYLLDTTYDVDGGGANTARYSFTSYFLMAPGNYNFYYRIKGRATGGGTYNTEVEGYVLLDGNSNDQNNNSSSVYFTLPQYSLESGNTVGEITTNTITNYPTNTSVEVEVNYATPTNTTNNSIEYSLNGGSWTAATVTDSSYYVDVFTINNLTPNTYYDLQIKVNGELLTSQVNDIITINTQAITYIYASNITQTTADISIGLNPGLFGYDKELNWYYSLNYSDPILINEDPSGEADPTTIFFTIDTLSPNTRYEINVYVENPWPGNDGNVIKIQQAYQYTFTTPA